MSYPVMVAMHEPTVGWLVYTDRFAYPLGDALWAWVTESWQRVTLGGDDDGAMIGYGNSLDAARAAYPGSPVPVPTTEAPLGEGEIPSDGLTLAWQVWPITDESCSVPSPVLVAIWDGVRSCSVYCDRFTLGADLSAWVAQSWDGLALGGGVDMGYGHDVAEACQAFEGEPMPTIAAATPLGSGILTDSDGDTLRWEVWPITEDSYSR